MTEPQSTDRVWPRSDRGANGAVKDRVFGYTLDVLVRETGTRAEEDVRQRMLTPCDVVSIHKIWYLNGFYA